MDQQQRARHIIMLLILVALGIAYSGLFYSQRSLTGINHLDGIIGVVFGLYICSHPAANLVDLLFYKRTIQHPFSSKRFIVLWLLLNMLVLLIGGMAIFIGTTRFIGRAD
jgi:hypothetical protein